MQQTLEIFDNGGQTLDRYTVIIGSPETDNQWRFLMSDNPLVLAGMDMACGLESLWRDKNLGRKVDLLSLPKAVQEAVAHRRLECLCKDWEEIG